MPWPFLNGEPECAKIAPVDSRVSMCSPEWSAEQRFDDAPSVSWPCCKRKPMGCSLLPVVTFRFLPSFGVQTVQFINYPPWTVHGNLAPVGIILDFFLDHCYQPKELGCLAIPIMNRTIELQTRFAPIIWATKFSLTIRFSEGWVSLSAGIIVVTANGCTWDCAFQHHFFTSSLSLVVLQNNKYWLGNPHVCSHCKTTQLTWFDLKVPALRWLCSVLQGQCRLFVSCVKAPL